jgi:hypothetical protein
MDAANEMKVRAISAHHAVDAMISNLLGLHSSEALKYFEAQLVERQKWVKNSKLEAEAHGPMVTIIKNTIIPGLKRVVSDAKAARRVAGDLEKERKRLGSYKDAKQFRAKAASLLGPATKLDLSANRFVLSLVHPGSKGIGGDNANVVATATSCNTYSTYYNALKIELATL